MTKTSKQSWFMLPIFLFCVILANLKNFKCILFLLKLKIFNIFITLTIENVLNGQNFLNFFTVPLEFGGNSMTKCEKKKKKILWRFLKELWRNNGIKTYTFLESTISLWPTDHWKFPKVCHHSQKFQTYLKNHKR